MKNKSIKKHATKKTSKEQVMLLADKLRQTFALHGVFIMVLIAGGSLGYALYKAQTYLNPVRNEARYQELTANNTYSKIDYTIVTKLSEALEDIDVQANKNIDPTRKNPFSE